MEQFDIAAARHHHVGELLHQQNEFDDAGYHYGVCGENAVKHALRAAGVEAAWIALGTNLRRTPMRAHFATLTGLVSAFQADIALHASGRHAGLISAYIASPAFGAMFANWSIDIRYADASCTPVPVEACEQWADDATNLMLQLVLI